MRNATQTKPCIFNRCKGTMRWTHVHSSDVSCGHFGDDDERLDVDAEYDAWVCEACGLQQRRSYADAVAEGKFAGGRGVAVRFTAIKVST